MKKTILIIMGFLLGITLKNQAQSKTVTGTQDNLEQTQTKKPQKRFLTPEDYKQWNSLSSVKLSNSGDWYSYVLRNTGQSTLFVAATKTMTSYDFPSGYGGRFSTESRWFACLVRDKGLGLLDLENGSTQWFPKVSRFEFFEGVNGKYLIAQSKPKKATEEASGLLIIDLTTGKEKRIPGVTEYQINPVSNTIAYIVDKEGKKSVQLRTIEATPKTTLITEDSSYAYKTLCWSGDGNALTFLQEAPEGLESKKRYKLYHYNDNQKLALKYLDPLTDPTLLQGMHISGLSDITKMSEDGTAVFFEVTGEEPLDAVSKTGLPANVQVWNTNDSYVYPDRKYGEGKFGSRKAVWWPQKDKTMLLETKDLPEVMVANNGKYMLSYNPAVYAPYFKFSGDTDLYLTDLETGAQHLFLKQQASGRSGFHYNVKFSPEGKYIYYFRDKHWWIYDLKKKNHINVTKNLGVELFKTKDDFTHSGVVEPYTDIARSTFWTSGDKKLVIYDRYDIWLISPKGKAQRLTKGKENKIRYCLSRYSYKQRNPLNTSQGLVLTIRNLQTEARGYAIWKPKKGLKTLVDKDMYIGGLNRATDKEAYIYTEEAFETPPRIMYWEKGMAEDKLLIESNPQQKQFHWGSAELMHYKGPEGKALKGVLLYPAGYKTGKTYPMLVKIYEELSHSLHYYENPTESLQDGYNPTNYTAAGYFVFLPDIKYEFNNPGVSALQCVEAGVKAVLKKGIVEADHIGLVGHSFGGYQAAFIMTQSKLFATAVIGAAITDVVSFYHSTGNKGSRMRWFEGSQYRFTDSYYQNPEAYLRNSPLHHASRITSPLLLWAAGKDTTIDYQQSIELYMGLRRMGKQCTLLLYPEDAHGLRKPENMVDLTRRMKAWLDKYLKPEVKQGVQTVQSYE